MIIKNELEYNIKFKINNSKYITLKQNEEYNYDVSGEVKIELLNPDISSIKRILKTLLLMPITLLFLLESQNDYLMAYSLFYEFNEISNDEQIVIVDNEKGYMLKKDNKVIDYNRVSRLKTLLLLIFFVAYSFLILFIIFITLYKINPNILKNLSNFKNVF